MQIQSVVHQQAGYHGFGGWVVLTIRGRSVSGEQWGADKTAVASLAGVQGDVMGDLEDPGGDCRLATKACGGLPDDYKEVLQRLLYQAAVTTQEPPEIATKPEPVARVEDVQRLLVAGGDPRDKLPVLFSCFGVHHVPPLNATPHHPVTQAICLVVLCASRTNLFKTLHSYLFGKWRLGVMWERIHMLLRRRVRECLNHDATTQQWDASCATAPPAAGTVR